MPFIFFPPVNPVIQKQVYKQYRVMNARIEANESEIPVERKIRQLKCFRCKEFFEPEYLIKRHYSNDRYVNICTTCNKLIRTYETRK